MIDPFGLLSISEAVLDFLDVEVSEESVETSRVDGGLDDCFGAVEEVSE
jgi:hypothetical protein